MATSSSRTLSIGDRFIGMVFSPQTTFEAVVAAPRWLAMLALVTIASAVLTGGFYATPVGQHAYIERAAQGSTLRGQEATEQQQKVIERTAYYMPYVTGVGILVFRPLICVVVAGLAFLIGSATGALVKFSQLFAVVVHANVINLVGLLVTTPLNYARESPDSPMNLAVLLPMLDERGFAGRLLGSMDIFLMWWVMVLAIGLSVAYRRKARPIAATLFAIYCSIAMVAAAIMSMRRG